MYRLTVETDKGTTEYENVAQYGRHVDRSGDPWLYMTYADGSVKQIRAHIIREIDVEVQR